MANEAHFYDDNEDLQFYVNKYIDWDQLVRITECDFKIPGSFENTEEALDTYKKILDMVGDFSANEIATRAAAIDKQHPHLENGIVTFPPETQEIFDQIKELGLHGLALPRSFGGMNCPFTLFTLCNELIARADASMYTHHGFHGGMALAMLLFSVMEGSCEFDLENFEVSKTRFQDAIEEIVAGDAWGSMDITEPDAGSDMAALRTEGTLDEDGVWRLNGQKIFITSGHAKYHFVIARTEDTQDDNDPMAGLKGLSMFLVTAFEDGDDGERIHHAHFTKVEDKIGHNGSATVAISYENTPGELIGKRGEGFKYMLMLMNNARVGVGFESIGVSEAAYRIAKDYASLRRSMGKTIDQHEMIADLLEEMRTDIQGVRAIAVQATIHEEMYQKTNMMLQFLPPKDEGELKKMKRDLKRHQTQARKLTPLLKFIASENSVKIARRAVQILGGFGYTKEYGAEKLLRDALVLPIYEGTSQIQSLMAMKDTLLGVMKDPKAFVEDAVKCMWNGKTARHPLERRVAQLQSLRARTISNLMRRMAGKKFSKVKDSSPTTWLAAFKDWDVKKDFSLGMLHAERLTRILSDVIICEHLLEQCTDFPERAEILERYLDRAEPRCRFLHDEIAGTGSRLLQRLANPVQE